MRRIKKKQFSACFFNGEKNLSFYTLTKVNVSQIYYLLQ